MVDIQRIRAAAEVLRRRVPATPLIYSEQFSRLTGAQVFLKLENLQRAGSFKIRGALNKLTRLGDRVGAMGVVAASAGNHAQGVALAASWLGKPATIVMPEGAPVSKQLATRDYGGTVLLAGKTVTESLERAKQLVTEGYTFLHPFDDEDVIAGQGTVGLELVEQLEDFDEVWVPVGGGGLISGVAVAVKHSHPRARVVGVQSEACPSALRALERGRPVKVEADRSIADGILVQEVGGFTFPLLANWVDEMRTVAENGVAMAVVQLLERKKLLAEGAGAVPLAALLAADPDSVRERRIVLVISGGNMDLNTLDRILEQGLIRTGRIFRIEFILDDIPGTLSRVLEILAAERANVLHIVHDRLSRDLPVGRSRVEIAVETRGFDHIRHLSRALLEGGFNFSGDPGASV